MKFKFSEQFNNSEEFHFKISENNNFSLVLFLSRKIFGVFHIVENLPL